MTENILNVEDPGRALWMTREEYITFGTQTLAITDDLLDEDGWKINYLLNTHISLLKLLNLLTQGLEGQSHN